MKINFKWVGGACWILQIDNFKIACDPVLCPKDHLQEYKYFNSKRLNDPIYDDSDFQNIDLWLLTHNHEDHIDNFGLNVIDKESKIIAHKTLEPLFREEEYPNVKYLSWKQETSISENNINLTIQAIPAIHAYKNFLSGQIGNGNGYFIRIVKNDLKYSIYITGDSVYKKGRIRNIENENFDLIIANAGSAMIGNSLLSKLIGRVTNNKKDITDMNSDLQPKMLIPVHWGTFSHYAEKLDKDSFSAYHNVKVPDPGEELIIIAD